MRARYPVIIGLVAVAGVVAAIVLRTSRPERPPIGAWTETWHRIRDEIPRHAELSAAPDPRAACSAAMGSLRSQESALFPAPDKVIESATRSWVGTALDMYMTCHHQGAHGLDEGSAKLTRIEAEIDAILARPRDGE